VKGRAGVTIVELLIGMAIGVAVFILILAVLDQATRLSERNIAQESLWREAISAAQTIEQALQGYASPDDLSIEDPEQDEFGAQEAAFYTVGPWAGSDVLRIQIGVPPDDPAEDEEPQGPRMIRDPIAAEGAEPLEFGEEERSVNFGSDEESAEIRFRYAYEFGKNLKPQWTAEKQTGKQPRLVEYTVTVSPTEPSERMPVRPVQLTGAVALGS